MHLTSAEKIVIELPMIIKMCDISTTQLLFSIVMAYLT